MSKESIDKCILTAKYFVSKNENKINYKNLNYFDKSWASESETFLGISCVLTL